MRPKNRLTLQKLLTRIIVYSVLIITAIVLAFPFYWMVLTTIMPASDVYNTEISLWVSQVDFTMYRKLLSDPQLPVARFFLNSLIISIGATIINILTAVLAAYPLSRRKIPGGRVFYYMIVATMMVPGEVVLIGLYRVVHSLGMFNSYQGMILPLAVNAVNFLIIMNYMMTIPSELDEAAIVDGATIWQVLWKIMLPLSKPAIYSAMLLAFLAAWQNFTIPYLLSSSNDMYPLSVGALFTENTLFATRQETLTLSTILTIPTLIIFIFTQRFVFSGITAGAIKG